MLVTFTHLSTVVIAAGGEKLPVGNGHVASQSMTGAGTSTAATAGTKMVRVGSDTAITGNFFGAGSAAFIPAGGVEYFPAYTGQTFTFTAA